MELFEPIRDFFYRRQARTMDEISRRLALVNLRQESPRGNFVFPGIDYSDRIEVGGHQVGHVEYGINPLVDRLYINMIEISPTFRRQGIGLGVLWILWSAYRVPIIPLHEYGASRGFWHQARRRFAAAGAEVGPELRGSEDMDIEQARWQHLVPELEHERLIRELEASPEWPAIQAQWKAGCEK